MADFYINKKILEVADLASSLMREYHVQYYYLFGFTNHDSELGSFDGRVIKINYQHALKDDIEEIKYTILKQIHAIECVENRLILKIKGQLKVTLSKRGN